jgi:hypothetical protein
VRQSDTGRCRHQRPEAKAAYRNTEDPAHVGMIEAPKTRT